MVSEIDKADTRLGLRATLLLAGAGALAYHVFPEARELIAKQIGAFKNRDAL